MKQSLTKEWLKENSIKNKCSVADLFQRLAMEDLFCKLFEDEKPVRFVLMSDTRIYGKAIRLRFKESMQLAQSELTKRLQKDGDISWTIIEENEVSSKIKKFYLEAQFEDMKVPATLELECRENEPLYPERKEMPLTLETGKLIYCVCAPEQQLAECFYMILDRLELISSMEYYEEAYEILKSYTVDGRRFAEELFLKNKNRSCDEMLLFKVKEYRDYHYMEKRWNSYVKNKALKQKRLKRVDWKRESNELSAWSEVVDDLCKFLGPIYLTMCKDEIFIGDWMPELGRFM